jgi:hypothetical protein
LHSEKSSSTGALNALSIGTREIIGGGFLLTIAGAKGGTPSRLATK